MNKRADLFAPPLKEPSVAPRSLVVASLDIGRVLANRDGVTFRARGTCMYPTVRPGDVLRIQSRPAAEVLVGDIAVCRSREHLFGHRVIGAGKRDGRAYIVTRPDRGSGGGDAPVFDENLLGVVVEITRGKKPVPLQPAEHSWLLEGSHRCRLACGEAVSRAAGRAARALALAHPEKSAWYQFFSSAWMALTRPRVTFLVRVPLNAALGGAAYRCFDAESFDLKTPWSERRVTGWTLTLHLDGARAPAAWATFALDAGGAWTVVQRHTRLRYRGAGFDGLLTARAERIMLGSRP